MHNYLEGYDYLVILSTSFLISGSIINAAKGIVSTWKMMMSRKLEILFAQLITIYIKKCLKF